MVSNGEVWEELKLNKTVAGEDMVNYASAGPGWRHQTSGACSSIIPHRSQTQVIFGLKLICGAHSQLLRLTELSRSQNNNSSISLEEEHLQNILQGWISGSDSHKNFRNKYCIY